MPIGKVWNVEWLNQNANRNYPVSEEATAKDVSGTFTLPPNLIVDLVWPVHASMDVQTDRFYLKSIAVFGVGITIVLGYWKDGDLEGKAIGSISVTRDTHTLNQSYFIAGVGDFYDSVGKIAIGSLDEVLNTAGYYNFDLAGGRLESTVMRPNLRGVTSLVIVNGEDRGDPMQGDIELIAGTNFRLVPILNPGENPKIRFDAISGAGLTQTCDCSDKLPQDAPPIKTINGIPADANGNFNLSGDECLLFTGITNGIEATDQCSQSCCGCKELDKIVTDLEQLTLQVSTLNNLTSRLDAQITNATLNVLSSKSGELPCPS